MDARTEAQQLFLELLQNEADIDGTMINVTNFFNSEYRLSVMKTLARPFVEKFKDSGASLIVTAPSSGLPLAHQVAEDLGVDTVFYPRKGIGKPKNLAYYELCVHQIGSPTGGGESLYFRRDLLDRHKGEKALIIDDFGLAGQTGNALYTELALPHTMGNVELKHGIKVAGIGILFDKGLGCLQELERTTGLDVFCLMELRKAIYANQDYSILHFNDPRISIKIKNQKTAVTNSRY
ncbi:MAG: hypothetical protein V1944_02185 [Candidatus Aenigmatarchaeota archaeon]